MKTVSLHKHLTHAEWTEIQCWCIDNLSSYVDTYFGVGPNNNRCFDFVFNDEGDAVWFELKWGR